MFTDVYRITYRESFVLHSTGASTTYLLGIKARGGPITFVKLQLETADFVSVVLATWSVSHLLVGTRETMRSGYLLEIVCSFCVAGTPFYLASTFL